VTAPFPPPLRLAHAPCRTHEHAPSVRGIAHAVAAGSEGQTQNSTSARDSDLQARPSLLLARIGMTAHAPVPIVALEHVIDASAGGPHCAAARLACTWKPTGGDITATWGFVALETAASPLTRCWMSREDAATCRLCGEPGAAQPGDVLLLHGLTPAPVRTDSRGVSRPPPSAACLLPQHREQVEQKGAAVGAGEEG
jgi:hypothetical protein